MENETQNLTSALEAMLFVYGEPLKIKKIAGLLKTTEENIKNEAQKLAKILGERKSGLIIFEKEGKLQLASSPDFHLIVRDLAKQDFEEDLTPAAEETLAIVAYAGPMGRAEIEYIRGVNSSFTLRNLLLRGLIERSEDTRRGNAYMYQISFDCLKHLGAKTISELPEYEKYKTLAEKFKNVKNQT